MEPTKPSSVTIIGAGIVGICCALSLLEKGIHVRLIDRDEAGCGASSGNAGVISPWSCVPQSMPGLWKSIPKWLLDPEGPVSIAPSHFPKFLPWSLRFLSKGRGSTVVAISDAMSVLTRPNIDLYRHYLSGTGYENLLRDSCYVFASRHPVTDFPNGIGWLLRKKINTPMEQIHGDEITRIEPALSKDYKSAILIKDQARTVSPGRLCKALAEKVSNSGGEITRNVVRGISPASAGGWIIHTGDGEETAEKVIVAAGAWSARLLDPLGVRVPLEAERGYHAVFKNPDIELNNSVADLDRHFVSSSMETGLRTAGTAEFSGLDAKPNYRRAEMLVGQSKSMIPDLNVEETEYWMGTRPSLPDSLPCIGEIKEHRGLLAAFGHSHYGLGMAPMTGRLVAEIATGGTPNADMKPYDIQRFSGLQAAA